MNMLFTVLEAPTITNLPEGAPTPVDAINISLTKFGNESGFARNNFNYDTLSTEEKAIFTAFVEMLASKSL